MKSVRVETAHVHHRLVAGTVAALEGGLKIDAVAQFAAVLAEKKAETHLGQLERQFDRTVQIGTPP